jgi:hypothetical protein
MGCPIPPSFVRRDWGRIRSRIFFGITRSMGRGNRLGRGTPLSQIKYFFLIKILTVTLYIKMIDNNHFHYYNLHKYALVITGAIE